VEEAPGQRSMRVVVIGAGMAGILSVIKLREAGFDDVTAYEKSDRVGGTWRENTYPGLSCDVPSHLYSYSFELTPTWTHRFSPGPEIQAYFERVAERHDVLSHVRFGEEVVSCVFDAGRWSIRTASGLEDHADVVIAATGVLHHPRLPDIPGLDDFGGPSFHSARWDHSVPIDRARMGIIGTGSTAMQIVSAVADRVGHLSLFQRTAQWVMPTDNPAVPAETRARYESDPDALRVHRQELSDLFDMFANAVVDVDSSELQWVERACLDNLEQSVRDPVLREKLRPTYKAACKRMVISPDFYEAIQHPNAEVVTDAIERIEPSGVRTVDGRLHELDVLVLATGFRADAFMRPMEVVGRGGVTLEQAWTPRPVAYLSISIPDFPNFFMINGPNGPVGNFSLIEVSELQVRYILQLMEQLRTGGYRQVAAAPDALARFEEERAVAARNTVWVTGCKSWYLDDRGLPSVWPWSFTRFREEMRRPDPADYEFA
jgi:cation diffusion facilitator CzcD-associated flavoprotein CzcO